jgi:hypothetical protein
MNYVIYFSNAGAPATGLTPGVITYKKVSDSSDVASPPAISEIGGGGYKFTVTPAEALFVVVDGGSGLENADRYKVMQITPNDADLDAPVSTRAPESGGNLAAVKAKTDNLPANPANESNVQGHMADALVAYDPPTKAELDSAVSPLALEANVQGQVAAALAAYDPPTKAEMDAALAALHNLSVGDLLAGDLSDNLSFPANSLADRLRKLFWILCNRMIITDASGAFTAYQGDGITPGATGTIVDNGTNTVRSAPTWP